MVLYHWNNYFFGAHDNRYLRFLTPSFIFITGFIISNIYFGKYGIADPQLPKRLIVRGLKILAVFLMLNVFRSFFSPGSGLETSATAHSSVRSIIDLYLIGSGVGGGDAKAIAFFVLGPISYLLILSALLVVLCRYFRYTVHATCGLCLLSIAVLNYYGLQSPNLELIAIGLLGVVAGYAPIDRINQFVSHAYFLVMAYAAYLVAITIWNVPYPLQIVGVYLTLMVIYFAGLKSEGPGSVRECVVLLGKYSLFGYISQIAIIQLLRPALRRIDSDTIVLATSFVLAFVFTILSVEVLDYLRRRLAVIDKAYKAVFA
jgi:hypothetical protein